MKLLLDPKNRLNDVLLTLQMDEAPALYGTLVALIIVTSLRSTFHNKLASSCSYFQLLQMVN